MPERDPASSDAASSHEAYVHPSAVVDPGASLGRGTKVWHFVHVCSGARIGEGCSLGQNVFVGANVRVGNGVRVQNNVSLYEGVEIEDDVFLGPSCVFTNVVNPRAFVQRKHEYRKTVVRKGASVGANATIVCGVTLGECSFIGAGAVVTRDVPAFALVVGVPAKRVGFICRCGERLPDAGPVFDLTEQPAALGHPTERPAALGAELDARDSRCHSCGTRYAISGDACSVL